MKNRNKSVIVVVAFVALIAIVGTMTLNRYETGDSVKKAETEQPKEKEETKTPEKTQSANTNKVEANLVEKEDTEEIQPEQPVQPQVKEETISFTEGDTLIWPVDGNVILNYSMDQTVYFATLDQYKYNPALVISGEEGEPVLAASNGVVKMVSKDSEIGEHIVLDMGNGYSAVYGQLREIRVAEGQRVQQGDVIGYLEKPTKYFVVEGCNLYFLLQKDGESKNPLEYLEG